MSEITCPIRGICEEARELMTQFSTAQLSRRFDDTFFGHLVERDRSGSAIGIPGAIAACFANNPECVLKQLYPEGNFDTGKSGVAPHPTTSNFYAGLDSKQTE